MRSLLGASKELIFGENPLLFVFLCGENLANRRIGHRASGKGKAVLVRCENCGRELESYQIKKGRVLCEECRKTMRAEDVDKELHVLRARPRLRDMS